MSQDYSRILSLTDEITRKLFGIGRFDLRSLEEWVNEIEGLDELQWVRNHLLANLVAYVLELREGIEDLRLRTYPTPPELQQQPDGTIQRAWTQAPSRWSEVLPTDIHVYIL
jgi:hypothetical protein